MAMLLLLLAGTGHSGFAGAVPGVPDTRSQTQAALALPEGLRLALDARLPDARGPELARVQQLIDFMIADDGLALRYQEHPTDGIAGSYAQRRVNCLSFTLMFVALARASGLQARAQASGDALAMRVLGDTVFRTSHVNAGVRIDGRWHSVDVARRSLVTAGEPEAITDAQAVALLHNNNAVEQLVRGDDAVATREIASALALDPESVTAWSNAGVVHWRSGRREAAERAYLQALQLQRDHVGALGNLVGMYHSTGDAQRAAAYEKRLQRAQASDPFSQFLIAQALAQSGANDDAVVHYRRAIRLMPDEPEFHRKLADSYEKQGKQDAARRSRQRAGSLEAHRTAQRAIRTIDEPASG
ncbi:tetratricopeptide repeat protein [Thermomonas sp.]|uniref:tetratricopeptide repeat protein n=1 Tax=Thermomonas sp. TaxID=1971895 RepID=UPI001B42356F|nr:tetratricopeptide repeat protein [Thermomonas sp.]MBK6334002.1 tetratricopeptide repeat protein [Thermomonas sp.]MBK6415346.1 tetratricopeptide repeat protein [Thermomonas sp.]MBK6923721.1 tetratricopeptide repeat protein [Thermomonas sp.]MBK7205381.1 tetratricopeptide repeat protein [Thermomonas sp.]MBK9669391.1 tetratricopeptide repeat protein [Thermomonas sp.]